MEMEQLLVSLVPMDETMQLDWMNHLTTSERSTRELKRAEIRNLYETKKITMIIFTITP